MGGADMKEKRYWGPNSEYGPFTAQEDGWPNRGEVVRRYRKLAKMTAAQLGELYGMQVNGIANNERWILRMEKENRVPQDETRRGILASILGIPPILLGLASLKSLDEAPNNTLTTKPLSTNIDRPERIDSLLNLYWKVDWTSTAQPYLAEIESTVADLQGLTPKLKSRDQQAIYELLCGFYPLLSTVYADTANYEKAMTWAVKGTTLADNLKNNKLRAVALYQRGFVSLEWGINTPGTDYSHVRSALDDFEAALPISIPRVEQAVLMDAALANAVLRRRSAATTNLEQSGSIMARSGLQDGSFVDSFANINQGRFHLGRGSVFTNLKMYDDAEQELDLADDLIPADQTRRKAWIQILRAQVYAGQRQYELATEAAFSALSVSQSISSARNINLIRRLHDQLITTSYKNSESVRKLGAALMLT
jgi:tetratricopeptide (TPR) repeat protein